MFICINVFQGQLIFFTHFINIKPSTQVEGDVLVHFPIPMGKFTWVLLHVNQTLMLRVKVWPLLYLSFHGVSCGMRHCLGEHLQHALDIMCYFSVLVFKVVQLCLSSSCHLSSEDIFLRTAATVSIASLLKSWL